MQYFVQRGQADYPGDQILYQLRRLFGELVKQLLRLLATEKFVRVGADKVVQVRSDDGTWIDYGIAQRLRQLAMDLIDP